MGIRKLSGKQGPGIPPSGFRHHLVAPASITPSPPTLCASIAVPAVSRTYAYTFRRVFDTRETHWLDGDGTNGVSRIEEGETKEAGSVVPEGAQWRGFSVELKESNGCVLFFVFDDPGRL